MAPSSAVIGLRTRRPYAAGRGSTTAGRTLAVKLGLMIGYWGMGLTARQQLELVLEGARLGPPPGGGGAARLRRGVAGRGLRLGCRDHPRLARAGRLDDQAWLRYLPDARALVR